MQHDTEQTKHDADTRRHDPPIPRGDLLPVAAERRIGGIVKIVLVAGIVLIGLLRLWNFTYDIPPATLFLGIPGTYLEYSWDGDVFSDEGFYSNDAVNWMQEGAFYQELDYNQFINLPLMQFIKAGLFMIFGVSIFAARLSSLLCVMGMFVAVYYLVRRFEDHWTSMLAVFLVVINHYLFAFSRYAIDEVPVAFWVTLTFAFAVRVRGPHWWKFAILTSAAFACALLTKTNAIFATPLIGVVVLMQELDVKRIALKFLLCSVVFLGIMGVWYVTLVMPHKDDFEYFFTLNVGLTSSTDLRQIWRQFERQVELLFMVDPVYPRVVFFVAPLLLILSARYRRCHLMWISLLWPILYMLMYSYYGRFYPRFFPMTVAPIMIWAAITMRHTLDLRGSWRIVAYVFAAAIMASSVWQVGRCVSVIAYGKNTWNEMAAGVVRIVEADPSGNRVVIGHTAGGLALRTNLIPRHDRYSPHPLDQRLEKFQPGWAISEGEFGIFANDSYYDQREWFEMYYEIELAGSWDILENFRGHRMHLYKLIPREDPLEPQTVIRAHQLEIESVSEQRRRAAESASSEVTE